MKDFDSNPANFLSVFPKSHFHLDFAFVCANTFLVAFENWLMNFDKLMKLWLLVSLFLWRCDSYTNFLFLDISHDEVSVCWYLVKIYGRNSLSHVIYC